MALNEKTLSKVREADRLRKQGKTLIQAVKAAGTSNGAYYAALKAGLLSKPKKPAMALIELPDTPKESGLVGVVFCRPDQVAGLLGGL